MIHEIEGNLLDEFEKGTVNIIIHQANCFNTMGSGIARQIRERFPEAYEADCKTERGSKEKLGKYSYAVIKGRVIINLYSQYEFGSPTRNTDYNALYDGLASIRDKLNKPHNIGVPFKIGSKLGGGDWIVVKAILEAVFKDSIHNLYIVKLPGDE